MSRFDNALAAAYAPLEQPLCVLAQHFADAVHQATAEGFDAARDPAVMLMGAFIAFHTHSDVNTVSGYHQLLALCKTCALIAPKPMDLQ